MAQTKFIVTYIDSHEMKQVRTTDTYSGARKIADYIQDKGGKAESQLSLIGRIQSEESTNNN